MCFMNRRIPIGPYGGVRGRELTAPSYSIEEIQQKISSYIKANHPEAKIYKIEPVHSNNELSSINLSITNKDNETLSHKFWGKLFQEIHAWYNVPRVSLHLRRMQDSFSWNCRYEIRRIVQYITRNYLTVRFSHLLHSPDRKDIEIFVTNPFNFSMDYTELANNLREAVNLLPSVKLTVTEKK